MGAYSPTAGFRFLVYLTVQTESDDLESVVAAIALRGDGPFVLVAPTRDLLTTRCTDVLKRAHAHFLALADDFVLDADGVIHARRPVTEILAPLLPGRDPSPKERFVFRRQGRIWNVEYEGVSATIDHSAGMAYLRYLLQNQGRDVLAVSVRGAGAGRRGAPVLGSGGEITDRRTVRVAKKRITDIDAELPEVGLERAEELRDERAQLESYLSAGVNLHGRVRQAGGQGEHDRQAVSVAIHRALAHLEERHAALAQHLRNSLKIGGMLSYKPERPVCWLT